MIYQFLTDEDVQQQIKQDLLEGLMPDVTERKRKITKAEKAVLKKIRSKASKWYDIDAVLVTIKQWNDSTNYEIGTYVYDDGIIYRCKLDNANNKPIDNTLAWESDDPRHELLVMYASDMLVYHLHSSVNPRKMPELRKERYNEAIGWLEDIADKNDDPDFPDNEDLDAELVIWGSNQPKKTYNF